MSRPMTRFMRLRALLPDDPQPLRRGVLTSVLQSLLGPVAVWQVTHSPELVVTLVLAAVYAALLGGNWALRRSNAPRFASLIYQRIGGLRTELFHAVQRAELGRIERTPGLVAASTRDLARLEAIPLPLLDTIRFAILTASYTLSILFISEIGFAMWVVILAATFKVITPVYRGSRAAQTALATAAAGVDRKLDELLDGFKQIRLAPEQGQVVFDDLIERALDLDAQRRAIATERRASQSLVTGIILAATGILLFVVPVHRPSVDAHALNATVMMFFFSINSAQHLLREGFKLVAIDLDHERVRDTLHALVTGETTLETRPPLETFETIELHHAGFTYPDGEAAGFTLGPIDLTIARGELIFVVGGNGSGKTTLMKLLTGLYPCQRGSIRVDGRRLRPRRLPSYRELFTTIYMDHHLFDRLYGVEADELEVDALLERFNLEEATAFVDGRFTKLDLSSGQAKRLAMVVALLERRPFIVLDEWAAHQDPQLRRYFYEALLPELKAQGKTIIAVSHDARYFHLADRVVTLDRGALLDGAPAKAPPALGPAPTPEPAL